MGGQPTSFLPWALSSLLLVATGTGTGTRGIDVFRALDRLPDGFPDAAHVMIVPPTTNKRTQPWYQTYHMTRYSRGCIDCHIHLLKAAQFDTQIPFLHEFDILITGCGTTWGNTHKPGREACVMRFPPNAELVHRVPEIDPAPHAVHGHIPSSHTTTTTNDSSPPAPPAPPPVPPVRPLRVHVSSHYPKAHDLFIKTLLPFFEAGLSR